MHRSSEPSAPSQHGASPMHLWRTSAPRCWASAQSSRESDASQRFSQHGAGMCSQSSSVWHRPWLLQRSMTADCCAKPLQRGGSPMQRWRMSGTAALRACQLRDCSACSMPAFLAWRQHVGDIRAARFAAAAMADAAHRQKVIGASREDTGSLDEPHQKTCSGEEAFRSCSDTVHLPACPCKCVDIARCRAH